MTNIEQLILILHSLAALLIVGLILIQHGKGADAGASFGSGASQTMMGVQGGGSLLTRWTAILVTFFFLTSLSLAYFAKQKSDLVAGDEFGAVVEEVVDTPADDEVPVLESVEAAQDSAFDEIPSAGPAAESSADGSEIPAGDEIPVE